MPHDLPKAYDPTAIEDHWAEYWVRENLFTQQTPDSTSESADPAHARNASVRPGGEPFDILLPPPNVTGRLHMGHMLNQTEMDILTRWRRMQGRRALWLPGTDHAGIATQMMVERQLAEEGTTRQKLGREAFVERVWEWKRHYGGAILSQMKRLGASVDWQREYFTMDENLSVAVREAFVRLYEQGLIYRGQYIVNWCPRCQTAISDLEVVYDEHKGHLWEIRYSVLDDLGQDSGEFITVATTRPETMLGDTAVAIHPEDERYLHLHGKKLRVPLVGREIPIVLDTWVSRDFGTGAVKVTPAHDPNDFELGKRHNLPSINVMDETALINNEGGIYKGLDRYVARKRIVADLEEQGLLAGVKDHVHNIGHCDRCKTVVEPRLSTQWFVKIQPLADKAIEAVKDGHIKFTPDQYKKTYLNWMENIYDWCISRQLWWGHRIPAWHCKTCGKITVSRVDPTACTHCGSVEITQETDVLDTWFSSGLLPVSVFGWPNFGAADQPQDLRAPFSRLSSDARVGNPGSQSAGPSSPSHVGTGEGMLGAPGLASETGESNNAGASTEENGSKGTGFSPYITVSPKEGASAPEGQNRADFDAFYPTSLLVTGFDILFFWVARMIMLGIWFAEDVPMPDGSKRSLADSVPFREVYIHALVRDANREKMSKTKGNVIDPIEIVKQYGTDAVRFTLASMASPGTDIAFNVARTEGYRAFANKIWNAARFIFQNVDRAAEIGITVNPAALGSTPQVAADAPLEERWITHQFYLTAALISGFGAADDKTGALKNYRFDEAAAYVYKFVWNNFCDWYLEIVKLRLNFDDPVKGKQSEAALNHLGSIFEAMLRLLSPFMPFLTEEIWHALYDGKPPAKSIALAQYPSFRQEYFDLEEANEEMTDIQEFIGAVRTARKELGIDEKQSVPVKVDLLHNATDEERLRVKQEGVTLEEIGGSEAFPNLEWVFGPNRDIIERLAKVSDLSFSSTRLSESNKRSTAKYEFQVIYERTIDVPAERDRLTKDIAKYEKGLAAAVRQLSNEAFLQKAPPPVVEGLKKQEAETRLLLEKAEAALDALPKS